VVKVRQGEYRWTKQHVLVMEAALGRSLVGTECVHHINGVRDDNRIENLVLCSGAEDHQRIHHSASALVYELLARGTVRFNRETRRYELEGTDAS
jgi:hypothetical protein